MSSFPSTKRHLTYFVVGAGLAALALLVYTKVIDTSSDTRQTYAQQEASAQQHATQQGDPAQQGDSAQQETPAETRASSEASEKASEGASDWTVGDLRSNGLRIKPSGRSDASAVLDPDRFKRPEVRRAYEIATEIPEVLNKLYCWCGCENRGVHRSNLGCFEDRMAVNCDVCRGTAKIAARMTEEGVTDAGKIQAAVDMEWGPEQAQQEQQNRQK